MTRDTTSRRWIATKLGPVWIALAASVLLAPGTLVAQSSTRLPYVVNFESGDIYTEFADGFNNGSGVTIVSQGCFSGLCARFPITEGTLSEAYGDFYFGDHVVHCPRV